MKRFLEGKNFYRYAICCIVVGCLLIGIGYCMGGFSWTNVSASSPTDSRTETFSLNSNTNLVVNDSNTAVEIETVDSDELVVTMYETDNDYYTVERVGDTITVTKHHENTFQLFGYWFEDGATLVIEVPEQYMNKITVDASNGSITTTDVVAQELDFKTSNASINLEGETQVDDITLKSSNGSLNMDDVICENTIKATTSNASINTYNVTSDSMTFTSSNGSINAEELTGKNIELTTSNAIVEFEDVTVTDSLNVKTSNGRIEGSLAGSETDYSISCDTSNGDCDVPTSSGNIKITLKTSNASVTIETE